MSRGRSHTPTSSLPAPPGPTARVWNELRAQLETHETNEARQRAIHDLVTGAIAALAWPSVCELLRDLDWRLDPEKDGPMLAETPDTWDVGWDDDADEDPMETYAVSCSLSDLVAEALGPDAPSGWQERCRALEAIDPTTHALNIADFDYHFEYGESVFARESSLDEELRSTVSHALAAIYSRRIENDPLLCAWDWSRP